MEVRWSPEAADDLARIVEHIRDSPDVARKVAATVIDAVGGLSLFPKRGRPGRIEGTQRACYCSSALDRRVSRSR